MHADVPPRSLLVTAAALVAVVAAACGDDPDPAASNCADGSCAAGGGASPPRDGGATCGDGLCSSPAETAETCPSDCSGCVPLQDVSDLVGSADLFFGYAALGTSSQTLSCGDFAQAREVAVSFTSPFDGPLVLSTLHPSTKVATAIELREGGCEGDAVGCGASDHVGGVHVTTQVAAGKTYVALVETGDDETGVFALGLHRPGVCEGEGTTLDVSAALLTGTRWDTDTASSTSSLRGTCAPPEDAPESRFTFEAPRSGRMVATTAGSATAFDTVLFVREGSQQGLSYCDSPEAEVGCATPDAAGNTTARFDVLAGRHYDLFVDGSGEGAGGAARLTLGYGLTSPASANLDGCSHTSIQDQFAFYAESGQAVYLKVDSVDAATAADTRFRLRDPGGAEVVEADDEVPCTFPPPAYECPEHSFVASASGLYTVEVYVGSSESCADKSLVRYALTVTLDDQPGEVILFKDQ